MPAVLDPGANYVGAAFVDIGALDRETRALDQCDNSLIDVGGSGSAKYGCVRFSVESEDLAFLVFELLVGEDALVVELGELLDLFELR